MFLYTSLTKLVNRSTSKMLLNIKFIYLVLVCQLSLTLGQAMEIEQECNILKTLETFTEKIKYLETEIKELKLKDSTQSQRSTYTRWGRTNCPGNGSELVYSGYTGGSWYNYEGSAAEFLCLPTEPIFAHYEDTSQGGGLVYGAEYRLTGRKDRMAFFPNIDSSIDLFNKKAPCAVCTTTRSTVTMVPARNKCHDGWTLEYKGYLVAGSSGHKAATQYICLDDEPEYLSGGGTRSDLGKLIYFVEGQCGSLKCPPYVKGRELTCAVCSK